MYGDLAPWFHLLTPPSDYVDDAALVMSQLRANVAGPLRTLLELGAGGGNTASHLSQALQLTLTDPSPDMLALSRTVNPDSEHIVGDMRTLRLGRTFDAVLIHDAICYMRTLADLRAAMLTAWEHLRPGGAASSCPTISGRPSGRRRPRRRGRCGDAGWQAGTGPSLPGMDHRPGPTDTTYQVDYAIMLRDTDGSVRLHHDRHVEGLFPRQAWLDLMTEIGFEAHTVPGTGDADAFVGRRP